MPAQQISATVDRNVYQEFEALRAQSGLKRSEAIEEAIKTWLKHCTDALIAEGCKVSKAEDLALVRASKRKALKALARNL